MHFAFTPSAIMEFFKYELLVRIFNLLYHVEYSQRASSSFGGVAKNHANREHAKETRVSSLATRNRVYLCVHER